MKHLAVLLLFVVSSLGAQPNILFCLADDWSYPHAGVYGDKTIRTPNFDRVAREGMLFTHAFSAAPSCTPSRAAILTGRYPHQLEEGSCLWGFLPKKFTVYPDVLERAGYAVGACRKGWGPGNFRDGGFTRNPAGPNFQNLAQFLKTVPAGKPFCFWFGSLDPHRPYDRGSGAAAGLKTDHVQIPPYWPDNEISRNDVLDYYAEVERFDRDVGAMLELLEKTGQLTNTIVVITGDNGMPFPRCKANLYDGGARQPLAVRWPGRIKAGQVSDAFVNLAAMAPTFLEAAGVKELPEMSHKSILPLLLGAGNTAASDEVFVERERHANVRPNLVGYPSRAIRTREYLYIRNFRPDRWPVGDPVAIADPHFPFGDCDEGPTKTNLMALREQMKNQFELCFGRRPAEELYDLKKDPHQMNNVAGSAPYAEIQKTLHGRLDRWMRETADPRALKDDDHWDDFPYYGGRPENRRLPSKK